MQDNRLREIRELHERAKARVKHDPWWVSTGVYIADVGDLLAAYDHLNDFEQTQCAKLLEKLNATEAKLAEAQRSEQAAVADMERIAYRQKVMPCAACTHEGRAVLVGGEIDTSSPCFGCCEIESRFDWRGPQAGRGEAE